MPRSFGRAIAPSRPQAMISLAAITTTVLALSGCGFTKPSSAGATETPEKSIVRFGGLPATERALVHLADEKGYFAEQGLQVQILDISNGAEGVDKLSSGAVDFSAGSYTNYVQAVSRGANLKMVSGLLISKPNLAPVLSLPHSKLRKPSDAPGKKIAISAPGTISEIAAKSVLRDKGVDYTRTDWVPMPFPNMAAALERGDVDGAVMAEPFATEAARSLGAVPVFDIFSGATADFPVSGVATTDDFARKNPATVQAFQRAIQAAKLAARNRYEIADTLSRHANIPSDVAPLIELGGFAASTNAARLQRVATLMHSFGLTPKSVDVRTMMLPQPPPVTTG